MMSTLNGTRLEGDLVGRAVMHWHLKQKHWEQVNMPSMVPCFQLQLRALVTCNHCQRGKFACTRFACTHCDSWLGRKSQEVCLLWSADKAAILRKLHTARAKEKQGQAEDDSPEPCWMVTTVW